MAELQVDLTEFAPPPAVLDEPTATAGAAAHRGEVVRRLLALGVSPHVLALVLPEWESTIAGASLEAATPGQDRATAG